MSDKPTTLVQCRLSRGNPYTGETQHLQAWIDSRGAKVGARVELLPSRVFWDVVEVGVTMSNEQLKKHQSDHRKSFSSIEPIGAPAKNVGAL